MDRFLHLDTMRFFFAVAVVLGHSHSWAIVPKGGLAVDFFFILSGFVITHMVQARAPSFIKFTISRFARMYPLHLATLFLFLLVSYYEIPNYRVNTNELFHNIALTHGLGPLDKLSLNMPSWSISVEFYSNIIILYALARYRLIGTSALIVTISYSILLIEGPRFDHAHMEGFGFTTLAMVRCAGGVAVGYLMYEFYLIKKNKKDSNKNVLYSFFHFFMIAIILYFMTIRPSSGLDNIILLLLLCILVMSMILHKSLIVSLLSIKYISYFGNISFGVYLLHWPLLRYGRINGFWQKGADWGGIEFTSFWIILLTLSIISYHLLELPSKRLIMSMYRFSGRIKKKASS